MSVGIIGHYKCNDHNMGAHHPESPARMAAIQDQLIRSGLEYVVRQYDAKPLNKKYLALAHSQAHINHLFNNAPSEGLFKLDDDTYMNAVSLNAALYSAGAVVNAVDLVMSNELSAAFCAVRPPGHHAEYDKSMGFCLVNNIAIGAFYALEKYALKRIAIVDFDVHHGNGTENIIKTHIKNKKITPDNMLFCSTYQYPFYPFEMQASNTPPIINTPLAATTKSADFQKAIIQHWLPALEKFKPQIIFISAGFDAHIEDDMSQISLTENDYRWVTEQLKSIANQYAHGRIVSTLEGGYRLNALGRSVVAHINGLIGY